jgi:hypothetical protein
MRRDLMHHARATATFAEDQHNHVSAFTSLCAPRLTGHHHDTDADEVVEFSGWAVKPTHGW